MTDKKELIKNMPKVDLHCHLDGSLRTETILDLARRQNYKLPADNVEDLRKFVRVPPWCRSLGEFLERFEVFYPLLKNAYALERSAYELCRDSAAENIKYLEVRFAPVLQKTDNFPIPEVIKAVLRGLKRGSKEFTIKTGIILCLYRGTPLEISLETVKWAKKLKNEGIAGVDVAGDESTYSLKKFEKPIHKCKKAGIPVTVHAGEAAGPDSIRAALDYGANRIGHGVALQDDKKLLKEVARKQIPLEICITSNVHTQVVKSYSAHPFRNFISTGVKVTLNTDDRGVSGIDLTHEYNKAYELGIKEDQLFSLALNGIEAAFLNSSEKENLEQNFRKEFTELRGKDNEEK